MATVNFPTTATDGTRVPNPSNPITEGVKTSTAIKGFDSGHEQRRQKGATLLTFSLNYVIVTDAAYQTIRTFFLAYTDATSFLWTHPTSKIVYKVRFDGSSFSGTSLGHNGKTNLWSLKFNLIEVR